MDLLTYYAQQSPITDPAEYVGLFADLPRDIAGLCRVSKMLACLVELDDRLLTEARPPEKRLIGCCHDFASLFCAMARHQGIPRGRAWASPPISSPATTSTMRSSSIGMPRRSAGGWTTPRSLATSIAKPIISSLTRWTSPEATASWGDKPGRCIALARQTQRPSVYPPIRTSKDRGTMGSEEQPAIS